jgi:histidinol-phosphate aminotransferase
VKRLVAKNIEELIPYPPGKPIEELEREYGIRGSIKLASNENPLGPSPRAVRAIRSYLGRAHFYPDGSCYYLKRKLAEKLRVDVENIILGNGSNEIIELLVRTFLRVGEEALISDTSFVVYRLIIKAAGRKLSSVPMKGLRYNLKGMRKKVNARTKLIFVDNPNNPTGTIVRKGELEEFLQGLPEGVICVVDEAYYEFVNDKQYPDTLAYLNGDKLIVTLRTFSKVYGLAGLRIGYGVAKGELIDYMERVRQPFNVNSLAQVGALAALEDREHLQKTRENNRRGLAYLYREMERMGLEYVPTQTNFFLINLKRNGAKVYQGLLREGVIVRPMAGYGLPKYIRVTVGLPEENERFVTALRRVLFT